MSLRALFPLLLIGLVACPPPCKQVCKKLLFDCSLDSDRVALEECEDNCGRQDFLYGVWEDEALQDQFDDHKRCLMKSSCDEIAAGVCYDGFEDLFLFDPDKELPPAEPETSPTG